MMCGSCCGAVTWGARITYTENYYKSKFSSSIDADTYFTTLSFRWLPVTSIMYATEFMFLSAAEFMVLDRMSDFVAQQEAVLFKGWQKGGHVLMVMVALGNAAGLAACIAAAIEWQKMYDDFFAANVQLAANNTVEASEKIADAYKKSAIASSIYSVQQMCEIIVLLLIVAAFLLTGVLCARRIGLALREVKRIGAIRAFYSKSQAESPALANAALQGRNLRLKMVGITAVVFGAFLLRAVASIITAMAYGLRDFGKLCPGVASFCDASCYNVYTHIFDWLRNSPEFTATVVLVSSPLTMLVALLVMTSYSMWKSMRPGRREDVPLQDVNHR